MKKNRTDRTKISKYTQFY